MGVWMHVCNCVGVNVCLCARVATQTMMCIGGSGRFSYALNDTKASIVPSQSTDRISVYPVAPGVLLVTANDVLLPHTDPATGLVFITLIHSIHIAMRDQVRFCRCLCDFGDSMT